MSSPAPNVAATTPACPVCDGTELRPHIDLGTRQFVRCGNCRTVFQSPLPTLDHARAVHTDRYDGATRGYFAKVDKKMRRARFEMGLAAMVGPRRGARFLDIGCNGGFMAAAAAERGYEAHGIDVDPVSIGYARTHYTGPTFYLGSAEELPATVGQFDMVHCSEVIEHVPQAKDFLATIERVLKPGGWLYLTTPNIYHWSVPRDVRKFKALRSNGHCIFYNPQGLRRALGQVGIDYRFSIPNLKPGMRMVFRKRL